jgi:hypothetical protein
MSNRISGTSPELARLPPRPAPRCQLFTIDHPIKGQATFGNVVTAVYAAMLREISTRRSTSRFTKPQRGQFALRDTV